MILLENFTSTTVILNRFHVKQLAERELMVNEYQCRFTQLPEQGKEQQAISSVCYKLGVIAVRLHSLIITKEEISPERMQSDDWELVKIGTRKLSCENTYERRALESYERKVLETGLKSFSKTQIEKASEGGLIWWITGQEGVEKYGKGWEVHRGRRIDIALDANGNLYLEIDIHHRFYTPWTLHQWLEEYPDIPITYVRNTYKDKNNNYISWKYEGLCDQSPEEVQIVNLGMSLAEYHRKNGATEQEVNSSYVVMVRKANDLKSKAVPHLSQRLSPSLTMEMLANIAEQGKEKQEIQSVFEYIRKNLDVRLKETKKTAENILKKVYRVSSEAQPLSVNGYIMPPAQLLAFNDQPVNRVDKVRKKGCARVGETKFGCLNLYNQIPEYPDEVRKCLLDVARSSHTNIEIDSYRTTRDFPDNELDQQIFWQNWSNEGIKTVLVVMPWSPNERKLRIRVQALQAGIATQFMVPNTKADVYKALNVVLGLLCKAGWQPVKLKPLDYPEIADLIIGFDTGTDKELYYGTSAFAVLADGQSLGWELPQVQTGETFSGRAIWQTVSSLVLKFVRTCGHYPRKLLLMRDGLVQQGEFQQTIEELEKKNIAVDVLGVRKSGAGRMGRQIIEKGEVKYYDASIGTVVFIPEEKSFTLVTSQPINESIGSVRPLRVVHEYGNTPLELIALQTYQLSQLHPASGFKSCRLPWVLHLADKSSKEFQRIRQISVLQNISREKLIAV
jgi:argonaute family protein